MTSSPSDLPIALVSGGSRGLGLSIVASLVENGYRVVTFSRRATKEISALAERSGGRCRFVEADMADGASLERLVRDVESGIGPISALINNAGVAPAGLLVRESDQSIRQVIDINLVGSLLLTRQVARGMMVRQRGRIISISSIVSIRGDKGTAAYSATKAGLDGMTRALARELGGRGITVNSVAPGYMETDLVAHLDAKQLSRIAKRTPLERLGRTEDVAGAILFLLSDQASFITGQTLVVDGGLTC